MRKKVEYRRWTDWEIKYVRYAYEEKIHEEIMELVLKRSVNAIRKFTLKEGLRNPNYGHARIRWTKEEEQIMVEHCDKPQDYLKAVLPHRSIDSIRSKFYQIDKYV